MVHVRIAGMAWLRKAEVPAEIIARIRKLRVTPRKIGDYDETPPEPIDLYAETTTEIGVPRAHWFERDRRLDAWSRDIEYEWDVTLGSPITLKSRLRFEGPYREQAEVIDNLIKFFDTAKDILLWDEDEGEDPGDIDFKLGAHLGGILEAQTGFGKTNVALEVIARLGVTTIIIVHKDFLLRQWAERIAKFLPEAKVGIVREDRCDFQGKDIVIAMAQSLALDDGGRYPAELYDWPGLLIVDEVHRVGAPTWAPIPPRFSSAFRLGLTATPRRRDGCDTAFWWHIGEVIEEAKTRTPEPSVRMVAAVAGYPDEVRTGEYKSSVVVNILCRIKSRNNSIISEVLKALRSEAGRKVMVLSHRLEHLRDLEGILRRAVEHHGLQDVTTSFYVGDWFGDSRPKLAKGFWEMDEDGRKEAIATIYRSLSRGQHKGRITSENGQKLHVVAVDPKIVGDILFDLTFDGKAEVALERFSDDALFGLAKIYDIAQKAKEKKRPVTEEELRAAARARVIFATYQMTSEGVDLPAVDTIVLATPSGDVEQAVGRGRRFCVPMSEGGLMAPEDCAYHCPWRVGRCKGKPPLIVADIVDNGVLLSQKRASYRLDYYRKERFKVAGNGT